MAPRCKYDVKGQDGKMRKCKHTSADGCEGYCKKHYEMMMNKTEAKDNEPNQENENDLDLVFDLESEMDLPMPPVELLARPVASGYNMPSISQVGTSVALEQINALTAQLAQLKAQNDVMQTMMAQVLLQNKKRNMMSEGRILRHAKLEYYHARKNDPNNLKELLGSVGFITKSVPWQMIRQMTDNEFDRLDMANKAVWFEKAKVKLMNKMVVAQSV